MINGIHNIDTQWLLGNNGWIVNVDYTGEPQEHPEYNMAIEDCEGYKDTGRVWTHLHPVNSKQSSAYCP